MYLQVVMDVSSWVFSIRLCTNFKWGKYRIHESQHSPQLLYYSYRGCRRHWEELELAWKVQEHQIQDGTARLMLAYGWVGHFQDAEKPQVVLTGATGTKHTPWPSIVQSLSKRATIQIQGPDLSSGTFQIWSFWSVHPGGEITTWYPQMKHPSCTESSVHLDPKCFSRSSLSGQLCLMNWRTQTPVDLSRCSSGSG